MRQRGSILLPIVILGIIVIVAALVGVVYKTKGTKTILPELKKTVQQSAEPAPATSSASNQDLYKNPFESTASSQYVNPFDASTSASRNPFNNL